MQERKNLSDLLLMKILILTSKNHLYANYILSNLISRGCFAHDQVTVWEQDSIIPGKSKLKGLLKYLSTSGFIYIFWQVIKIYMFLIKRLFATIKSDCTSYYYPYERLERSWKILLVNGIKRQEAINQVKKINPDLIISLMSKEIIPESILSIPRYGAVNLHPAPLPNFRGVSPTFWALSKGSTKFGVTLHVLDNEIDTGGLIAQRFFSIKKIHSEHEVYMMCCKEGVNLLENFLRSLHKNEKRVIGKPYHGPSSYFSLPTKQAVNSFISRGCVFFYMGELL